jgi:hypothetical protein
VAERVVIAQIALDDTPVVAATQRVQQQIGFMESGTRAVVAQMFSLRRAATALLGGFTLAGIILQLGNLAKQLITNTALFKEMKEVAEDLWREFALGETAIDQFMRKQQSAFKDAGLDSTLGSIEKLQLIVGAYQRTVAAIDAINKQSIKTLADAGKLIALRSDLAETQARLMEAFRKFATAAQQQTPFEDFRLDQFTDLFEAAFGVRLPTAITATVKPLEMAVRLMEELNEEARQLPLHIQEWEFPFGARGFEPPGGGLSDPGEDLPGIGDFYGSDFQKSLLGIQATMNETTLAANAMAIGFEHAAGAIAAAFAGISGSLRQALHQMFLTLSQMAFVYALWETAMGIAVSAGGISAAVFGDARQHFRAAATFAAVGAAAGLAARAFGGGEAVGGGAPAPAAPNQTSRVQNITVIFEGNVASDEWMRGAVIDIQKALADGAGGGGF